MSAHDDFWQAWGDDRTVDPRLHAHIAAAMAAAQRSSARAATAGDVLSERGSALHVDGLRGVQFLRPCSFFQSIKVGTSEMDGYDYCARVDVAGVLPWLLVLPRFSILTTEDIALCQRELFAPTPLPLRSSLSKRFVARSRAPDLLRAFDSDALADALGKRNVRLALRPETDRRSVVEVDVHVGDGRDCEPALRIVDVFCRTAQALVEAGAVFAEREQQRGPSADRIEALVRRVSEAVSWVTGPVARVGDGVEARLCLEEQPDAPSVLRFDLDNQGLCAVFFEGRLIERNEKPTRLRPQEGLFAKLRALADLKVDNVDFDAAWLIDGDEAVARTLAGHSQLLLRLRERNATVEVGPAGLVVRVPAFDGEDAAVVDVAGAVLGLWRALCRQARGFADQP